MKGTKDTEVLTFATGIVNEKDSLTIPRITKAAIAFQNLDGNGAGMSHSRNARRHNVAADTALIYAYISACCSLRLSESVIPEFCCEVSRERAP
jgi:hypothetical protein